MRLRLAEAAQRDIDQALEWSAGNFGTAARQRYQQLIKRALLVIKETDPPTSRDASEIAQGMRLFHLRNSRLASDAALHVANPRHFLAYRREGNWVIVLRLLHDASDLPAQFN